MLKYINVIKRFSKFSMYKNIKGKKINLRLTIILFELFCNNVHVKPKYFEILFTLPKNEVLLKYFGESSQ